MNTNMLKEKKEILELAARIRAELEKPQSDRRSLNELMDTLLQKQTRLLEAKEAQLINANRMINDLILMIRDKVTLIKKLESQINWVNNHTAYKLYVKAVGPLKGILKKK